MKGRCLSALQNRKKPHPKVRPEEGRQTNICRRKNALSGVICRAEKQLFHLSYQGFYAMITMIFDHLSWESLFFAPVLKQVINSVASLLTDQTHPFHLSDMLRFGGDEIEPGCFNTGMAQHIRQLCHIPANPIEGLGKQVPQIVRKDLGRCNPRLFAERLHLRPYLAAAHPFSVSGEEYLSGDDFSFSSVFFQLPAELSGKQDGANLSF